MSNAELLIIILLFAILILLANLRTGLNEIVKALQAIYDRKG